MFYPQQTHVSRLESLRAQLWHWSVRNSCQCLSAVSIHVFSVHEIKLNITQMNVNHSISCETHVIDGLECVVAPWHVIS